MNKFQKKLFISLIVLAILTPAGLILPELFKAGDAWGEWSSDTLKEQLGFIPAGLQRLESLWSAPVPDYNLGGEDASMIVQIASYIFSALLGIILVGGFILIFSRLIRVSKKESV
jgi:hypothetical protein